MRKSPAHFKPETKQPTPKKKNVVTATLCIVLALVLVMAVAVTGCNSTNAPESEASSQTSPATPTAEPTPTPEPTRAMSEGRFQVTCQQFADLYISFLQDSESNNSNLTLEADENGNWRLYKGEMDLDMALSFENQGSVVTAEETFDTVHFYCSDLVAQGEFYVSPFSVVIQTIHPDLSYGEATGLFGSYLDEMAEEMDSGNEDTYTIPKEIDGINYELVVSMDYNTGKSTLELVASEEQTTATDSEVSELTQEEEPEFFWNVPVEKAGITAGFYTDGEEYYFEMSSETSNSASLLNWLYTGLFTKMDWLAKQMDTVIQNSTSYYEENGISYSVMEGYGRKWVAYTKQVDMDSDTGGPGLIGLRVNMKEELEACYAGEIGESDVAVVEESIPPLTLDDFIISGTAAEPEYNGNVIDSLNAAYGGSSGVFFIYYDPAVDNNQEEVVTTHRNISLGDTKDDVLKAYGDGESGTIDLENDYYYNNTNYELQPLMRAQAVSYCRYYSEEGYGIHFYFDENELLTWIFFST
mgnify:FL=1